MSALNLLTMAAPEPEAERVVAALVAVTGTSEPDWWPLVLPDGSTARHWGIALDDGIEIRVSERPDARDLPRALTLTVSSITAATERLTTAGFTVIEPEVLGGKVFVKPIPGFTLRLRES